MTERSLKDKQFQVGIVRSTNRRQALSERLAAALKIWNLETIQEDDVDELTESVATGKGKSKHYKDLNKFLPGKGVRSLCQCGRHGEEIAEGIEDTFHLVRLNSWLKDFAVKLWLLAHLDPNSQRILLTIGPNRDWRIPNIKLNKESYGDFVFTKMLLSAVAMRLVGRSISITCPSPLALVAGGAVIGLRGNEAQPILEDVGHSIFITPGSIELPERRAKEVYQPQIRRKKFTPSKCLDINGIQRLCDGFGEAKYSHVVEFTGYVAELKSVLQIGENVLYLDALRAINIASRCAAQDGCLVECASGQLDPEEVARVTVADINNYNYQQPTKEQYELTVFLAQSNILVQRAIISTLSWYDFYKLQDGDCVHCAVRFALRGTGRHFS